MKRLRAALFLAVAVCAAAGAQAFLTAEQFFAKVSDKYAAVDDYEASISISSGGQKMSGKCSFKSPGLLRIDFVQPADQVIVFDGQRLTVYIPQYRAALQQETGGTGAGGAALASREGLGMMRRNYSIAWESSPQAVPLDEGSDEMVQRLVLTRKNASEGFKTLRLSISQNLLIRRIEGWTVANERIAFDFQSIRLNQGIPASRFIYDAPASANVYNNFLFQ